MEFWNFCKWKLEVLKQSAKKEENNIKLKKRILKIIIIKRSIKLLITYIKIIKTKIYFWGKKNIQKSNKI